MKQNLLIVAVLIILSLFIILFMVHVWEQKESLWIIMGIMVLVVMYLHVALDSDKKTTYQFKQQIVSNQSWKKDEEQKKSVVKIPNRAVYITINELASTEDMYGYTVVQWLEPIQEVVE